MQVWILFVVYVLLSAMGLLMIKLGSADTGFAIQNGLFSLQVPLKLIIGIFFYASSFLLSVYIMSKMKLSLFYPMGTGTILVLTALFGYLFLKEHIGIPQMFGMALILAGVVLMNAK